MSVQTKPNIRLLFSTILFSFSSLIFGQTTSYEPNELLVKWKKGGEMNSFPRQIDMLFSFLSCKVAKGSNFFNRKYMINLNF